MLQLDTILSFKEQGEEILGQLLGGSKEREIVLITGMGGLGKTTLAERLYDEEVARQHFDIRAWCTVSQEYDYKDSMRKLYKEVCDSTTLEGDDGVAEKLRQGLMGRRYLVVLDDIWTTEAWEELDRVLPSCGNGSRIVLTSRQENLVVLDDRSCHRLPFFTGDESWELLQMKLFGEEGKECPKELASVGKRISKKCGGLPLVFGLVAGLLKRIEKKEEAWSGFLEDLSSRSELRGQISSNEAIELSYKHLPRRLQPCLLYFAAYPEDTPVEVSRLMGLWIAEGFVNAEDAAEDNLNNLVSSNLVMVFDRKYDGRVSWCIVHDLVREFCLEKARDENLLRKVAENGASRPPRVLCLREKVPLDSISRYSSSVRALLGYHESNWFFRDHFEFNTLSVNFRSFQHLTILDFEDFFWVDKSILSEINSSLVNLRYLALYLDGQGSVSPSSLQNLGHLVTLKLTSHSALHIPTMFWNMTSLRHFFNYHECQPQGSCFTESSCVVEETPNSEILQSLYSNTLSWKDRDLLCKFPNIKLLCFNVKGGLRRSVVLDSLPLLEHLKLVGLGFPGFLSEFSFPSNIKELELDNISLPSFEISRIAHQLPNLEAFVLKYCTFKRFKLNIEQETRFPKLKYLELVDPALTIWDTSSADESFPVLEQLILRDCSILRQVPWSFADVLTLKVINVYPVYPAIDDSVKKICKMQGTWDMSNSKSSLTNAKKCDVECAEEGQCYDFVSQFVIFICS